MTLSTVGSSHPINPLQTRLSSWHLTRTIFAQIALPTCRHIRPASPAQPTLKIPSSSTSSFHHQQQQRRSGEMLSFICPLSIACSQSRVYHFIPGVVFQVGRFTYTPPLVSSWRAGIALFRSPDKIGTAMTILFSMCVCVSVCASACGQWQAAAAVTTKKQIFDKCLY